MRANPPGVWQPKGRGFHMAVVSTSVMVAGLGRPEFLVELTPVAVIPEGRVIAV